MIYFTAHTFKCVCHCRRAMFRVLGIYNFDMYFLQGSRCGDKIKPTEAGMIYVSLITFTKRKRFWSILSFKN